MTYQGPLNEEAIEQEEQGGPALAVRTVFFDFCPQSSSSGFEFVIQDAQAYVISVGRSSTNPGGPESDEEDDQ